MKTFSFNHNDYVSVTLTKEGAEFLSRKRKEFYDAHPQFRHSTKDFQAPKEVFVEGEIYRTQFWSLINDFDEMIHIGMASPFELGKITVESSIEGNMENCKTKGKTISEIRSDKAILQSEILNLIRKFEEDNEVHVQCVHLTDAHYLSSPLPETVEVRVDFMV